jgi:hypothetical protein
MKTLALIFVAAATFGSRILLAQGCFPEGFWFETQGQIDNFQTNYPGCTEIEGSVTIYDYYSGNITNLAGLSVLTSIGSYLEIGGNSSLTTLTGLDNLTSVGGSLYICCNDSLTSLMGLENLTSIMGDLNILENEALTSLTGLDNIQANSITDLYIYDNSTLEECDVYSICQYLAASNWTIEIHDNDTGCNSTEEVILACQTAIDENKTEEPAIFPNPATSFITLTTPQGEPALEVIIYNHLGQKVLTAKPVNNTVDVSGLKAGMYLIEVSTKDRKERYKFVKN